MPPRVEPRIYLLQIKTHKLSINIIVEPTETLEELKQEVFEALTSDVGVPLTRGGSGGGGIGDDEMQEDHLAYDTGLPPTPDDIVPQVTSLEDFELCRAVMEKNKPTGEYEPINANETKMMYTGITGWETLFIQFRDKETGELLPPKYTLPPLDDEEDEGSVVEPEPSSTSLGKRKADI